MSNDSAQSRAKRIRESAERTREQRRERRIIQITPAEGWSFVWLDAEREDGEPLYRVHTVACWALLDDGTVEGLEAGEEGVVRAEEFMFRDEHLFGILEYVHASQWDDPTFVKDMEARCKRLIEKANAPEGFWP